MAMTSLTLAWLLTVASPTQATDVVPINNRKFKIPILIDPDRRAQIKQLVLFASTDQGDTWRQEVVRSPDQDHFPFQAQADGVHWFKVALVDQEGNQQPPDIYKMPTSQKILVDTVSPDLKIKAVDRQGEELQVTWDIAEEHPDLGSLRLDYRPSSSGSAADWQPISLTPELSGRARVRLPNAAAVTLRLELRDQAGNTGSILKEVPAAVATDRLVSAAAPAPAPAPGPLLGSLPAAAPPAVVSNSAPAAFLPNGAPLQPPPALAPALNAGYPAPVPPPVATQPNVPALPGYDEGVRRVVATNNGYNDLPAPPVGPGAPAGPRPTIPNAYIVNDPQINLDYEVVRSGSSGVGKVELWLTDDEGRTWRSYADDPDQRSPLTAKLPGQGVFGLRLVTISGAGLTEGPPQANDPPEMRIEVDQTPPTVQLFEPRADTQRPDTLVISWNASDRNLATKPVTVEFAEKPEGPWLPIVTEQPGIGSHPWQPPKQTARVFLRVSALDTAGNRSVAETRESLLVDLNKPKARLRGLGQPPQPSPVSHAAPLRTQPAPQPAPVTQPAPLPQPAPLSTAPVPQPAPLSVAPDPLAPAPSFPQPQP